MPKKLPSTAPRDLPSVIGQKSGSFVLGGILAGTLVLWASAFVAIPIALESVDPIPTILSRLTLSSIFLTPILVRDWAGVIRPRLRQDFWQIGLMALSGIFFYLLFLTFGQRTVGAGQTSFIINMTPLVTGLLAALVLKEAFRKRMLYGALVALLGVSFLVFRNGAGLSLNFDAVLVLLAMLSSAVFYITQRRLTRHYNPLTLTAMTLVGGTILFLPFFPGAFAGLEGMTTRSAQAILYLGIFTILPYIGWAYVLSRMEVGKAVLFLYLIPIISTFLGWWIRGEAVTMNLVFAGALIILGVAIGTGVLKGNPYAMKQKFRKTRVETRCPGCS